ncbi:glycosyltransferase [Ferruginibacter paludis]|uniref:glycosyltransferase family 2 protein n=1 Tax=Ferruginibacter paludis TaxID=1310417 RepID=UPI0025B3D4D2|nr:glycosyltransferase [Ferruginibacter paludis]MDN3658898.1 glycosyltransferase [Ferruginibacter paludis]
MKLSIIIPVYNVEDYIEKCILSLQNQDIPRNEYEIIVINDGSPDNSRAVILQLIQQFDNIVFIDQENKGVSLARNAGIDKASGRYLIFIDPDDYVEPNTFSRILEVANEKRAQVAFLGFTFLLADNSVKKKILFAKESGKVYDGINAYKISRGDGTIDPDRSVAILFETAFINKYQLRNLAAIPYLEDGEFLARVMCLAERCIFDGNKFYLRTTRLGSATNSGLFYTDRAIKGFIIAANNLFRFQQSTLINAQQKQFLNQPLCKFILLAINSSFRNKGLLRRNNVVMELNNLGIKRCPIKSCNKYYWRDGFFFNLSPKIYSIYKPIWSLFDSLIFRLFKVHP